MIFNKATSVFTVIHLWWLFCTSCLLAVGCLLKLPGVQGTLKLPDVLKLLWPNLLAPQTKSINFIHVRESGTVRASLCIHINNTTVRKWTTKHLICTRIPSTVAPNCQETGNSPSGPLSEYFTYLGNASFEHGPGYLLSPRDHYSWYLHKGNDRVDRTEKSLEGLRELLAWNIVDYSG